MSTGQTMITAAFFVLLTAAIMTANKMMIESEKPVNDAEVIGSGQNFANILLNEIKGKIFDHNVDSTSYQTTSAFTTASSLGPEGSESFQLPDTAPFNSITKYDDIDDYNGYQRSVNSSTISGYSLSVQVYYVTKTDTKTKSTVRSYFKRIDVTVQHSQYLKAMTISSIVTY